MLPYESAGFVNRENFVENFRGKNAKFYFKKLKLPPVFVKNSLLFFPGYKLCMHILITPTYWFPKSTFHLQEPFTNFFGFAAKASPGTFNYVNKMRTAQDELPNLPIFMSYFAKVLWVGKAAFTRYWKRSGAPLLPLAEFMISLTRKSQSCWGGTQAGVFNR